MSVIATLVAVAMAGVLAASAVPKLRRPADLAATIRRLGAPQALASPAAVGVAVAEVCVATALLLRPDTLAAQIGVAVLALMFAAAGALALRIPEAVACNCFGAHSGRLGVRQIVLLIPWLAGVAVLHRAAVPLSAAYFASTMLGVSLLYAVSAVRSTSEGRGDRRSAEETYEWLPSH